VNSKDWIDFPMLFTLRERRKTSDSSLSRVRSKVLRRHPRRLDSEALRRLQRRGLPHRTRFNIKSGDHTGKIPLEIFRTQIRMEAGI
jgi:hypothetical protein